MSCGGGRLARKTENEDSWAGLRNLAERSRQEHIGPQARVTVKSLTHLCCVWIEIDRNGHIPTRCRAPAGKPTDSAGQVSNAILGMIWHSGVYSRQGADVVRDTQHQREGGDLADEDCLVWQIILNGHVRFHNNVRAEQESGEGHPAS